MSDAAKSNTNQHKSAPELTATAIVLGIILAVIMGAANVYLGLRAGMTVSASIPAAVVSMGILGGIMRRRSVLESNLVQTAASAGESLAAGIIFTMPALLLTGVWTEFHFWTTTLIALSGGLLGVLLMIPMRQVFVVNNQELKFPEGVACAEVLRAGTDSDSQQGMTGLGLVVGGIVVGGIFKLLQSLIGFIRTTAEVATIQGGRILYFGTEISPALLSVGYIVTLPIALQIFAGGTIGWLIAIPLLGNQGLEGPTVEQAGSVWSSHVRYIGVGAMLVGGIASIFKVRYGLLAALRQLIEIFTNRVPDKPIYSTERNLDGRFILLLGLVCVALIAGIYFDLLQGAIGVTILTTALMLVMSFFFAAVASYIVGLVGNSNSPVSGMTITAVLGTGGLMLLFGFGETAGIVATLGVAGVVCCVACTSGDVCNDLKTGHLVGASPRNQQITQVIGVLTAAFVMAPVMTILHQGAAESGGIGGKELAAPQAGLFAALAEGFFSPDGHLPKDMVAYGVAVGVLLLIADLMLAKRNSEVRLHVMPVAVGIYLPFGLSVPILLGGMIRYLVDHRAHGKAAAQRGVLIASGVIAGESLVGVLLGILAYLGIQSFNGEHWLVKTLGLGTAADMSMQWLAVAAMCAVAVWMYRRAVRPPN